MKRVLVTGLAGAGKSTFSRTLADKTGLPLILLDLSYWRPGWQEPTDDEWREQQRAIIAGDEWILDGNYHETLELRPTRADTVVYLHTKWWLCSWRAFRRGVRRPTGMKMPDGALGRQRDPSRPLLCNFLRLQDGQSCREACGSGRELRHARNVEV